MGQSEMKPQHIYTFSKLNFQMNKEKFPINGLATVPLAGTLHTRTYGTMALPRVKMHMQRGRTI